MDAARRLLPDETSGSIDKIVDLDKILIKFSSATKAGGGVHPAHARLVRILGDLVRAQEFNRLIPLVEETLNEKASG
jgi:hypothetical protein